MRTFTKEGDKYVVKSDSGQHDIKLERVGVDATFSKLIRRSTRGFEKDHPLFAKEGEPEKIEQKNERSIIAQWKPEDYHFETISEEGEKKLPIPARVYIAPGDFDRSNLWHFAARHESPEDLYLSFYLSQEWFDWLWDEIGDRPSDLVGVRFNFDTWLAGIESHMYYEVHYNPIRIEPEKRLHIHDAVFHVGATTRDEVEGEPLPKGDTSEDTAGSPELVWLKRVFWALVVIAGVLILRR